MDTFRKKLFPGDVAVGEHIAQTLAEEGQNEAALQRFRTLAQKTAFPPMTPARSGYRYPPPTELKRNSPVGSRICNFQPISEFAAHPGWRPVEAG